MIRASLPIFLLTSLAPLASALTESGEKARQELHAAITAEEESQQQSKGGRPGMSGVSYLKDLDRRLAEGAQSEVDISLERIAQKYTSPAVTQAVEKLKASLELESAERENNELGAIEAMKKEISEAIPKATTARDLDGVIERLVTLMNSTSDHRTKKVTVAIATLVPLKTFASGWQDYLQAHTSGDGTQADRILRYLAATNGPTPVPRSMILSRMGQTPVAPARPPAPQAESRRVVTDVTELDQMTDALRLLREMHQNLRHAPADFDRRGMESTINALSNLEKTYQNFRAGLPTDLAFLNNKRDSAGNIALIPSLPLLEAKLLLLVLPAQLGIAAEDAVKPGETVTAFLNRTEKEAAERGNADVCAAVIDARLSLDPKNPLAGMEKAALQSFRVARAQEAAGQAAQAVHSYQTALQSGPSRSLALLIGKRLEEIRRAHPDETRKAFERYQ